MNENQPKHTDDSNNEDIETFQIPGNENVLVGNIGRVAGEAMDYYSADADSGATPLGHISDNPENRINRLTEEEFIEQFFESRIITKERAEREGLVPVGPVEHRILEPTDAPGYGGYKNRLAHILLRYPTAQFVKIDNGFQAYVDPSGPDYKKSE